MPAKLVTSDDITNVDQLSGQASCEASVPDSITDDRYTDFAALLHCLDHVFIIIM